MANIDEAFAALSDVQSVSVNENVDFVVDSYLRVISIPVRGVVLGVEGDKDVNRVTFRMSRTYKGVDMSQFQIRINYANANNELNYFKVTEITVSDDEIVFVWVVGADAVAYVGNVEFVVRFIKLSGSNIIQELNTTLATAKSLIGLSVDGEISPVQREDLLAHFYNEIDAYSETKKNEILDSIPEDYTALANEVDELKGDIADIEQRTYNVIFGKNRFNPSDVPQENYGKYVNPTGNGDIRENTNYFYSYLINLHGAKSIAVSGVITSGTALEFFDSNKERILYIPTPGNDNYVYSDIPSNAKYMRFSSRIDYMSRTMVEFGNEITSYVSYVDDKYILSKQPFYVIGKDKNSDFSTVTECLANTEGDITCYVKCGEYEETIACYERTVNIIGENKEYCILCNTSGEYSTPPVWITSGKLENLTIYSKNIGNVPSRRGYAVHLDLYFNDDLEKRKCEISNCIIISDYNNAIGCGTHDGSVYDIHDCELITTAQGIECFKVHQGNGQVGTSVINFNRNILHTELIDGQSYTPWEISFHTAGFTVSETCKVIVNATNNILFRCSTLPDCFEYGDRNYGNSVSKMNTLTGVDY